MDPVGDAFEELIRAWRIFSGHMDRSVRWLDDLILRRDEGLWKEPIRYDDYLPLIKENTDLLAAMVHLHQAVWLQDEE